MDWVQEFQIESWTLFSVGMLIIGLRFTSRLTLSKTLMVDDYIMMWCAFCYFGSVFSNNNIGLSNLMLPEDYDWLTPEIEADRIRGSKVVIVSEQAFINLIWSLKTCLLILYYRMFKETSHELLVKLLGGLTLATYIATQISFFTQCIPFYQLWQVVPAPPTNCVTYFPYAVTSAVGNILTDFLMLCLGIPMFLKVKVSMERKVALIVVFGAGIFVITASILKNVFLFRDLFDPRYVNWGVRESSTAVYVTNLPVVWPLIRRACGFNDFLATTAPSSKLASLTPPGLSSKNSRGALAHGGDGDDIGGSSVGETDLQLTPFEGRFSSKVGTVLGIRRAEARDRGSKGFVNINDSEERFVDVERVAGAGIRLERGFEVSVERKSKV